MRRKFIRVIAVAAAATMATAGVAHARESANGSGATFPQQFMASATAAFNAATGNNVTYANPGGGSGRGKRDFRGGLTDFGGTDSAVTGGDIPTFDWVYVPYVGGAISIAYRLDEVGGATLSLSPATLNGIFGGTVTKWNDPSIANDLLSNPAWVNSKKRSDTKGVAALIATNTPGSATVTVSAIPNVFRTLRGKSIEIVDTKTKRVARSASFNRAETALTFRAVAGTSYEVRVDRKVVANFAQTAITLPNRDITVVYRSDGSGTSNNFCNFMRQVANADWVVNDAFTTCIPGGSTRVASFGSRFQGQSGSANVSNYVADNNGAIGYTEVSFVTDATRAAKGMKSANIRNAAGRYVSPTAAATSAFLSGSTVDARGFVTFNYAQTTNTAAYPIVAITYGLAKTATSSKNAVVRDFFLWVLNTYGPANAEALGYAPLSGTLKDRAVSLAQTVGTK